jgi:LPLT family lysophospholipid transporter-like MFS transporter
MRALWPLLVAQFLTAFADNAILFTAIAMALTLGRAGGWYIPAMQSAFLVAFVLLAPWVGRLADVRPKPRVLVLGNLVKLVGAALILGGLDPLLAYAIIGVGAAVYGPAKYGILPELVGHGQLVRANGLMEGSTIVAIVLGMVVGAQVADHSIDAALGLVVAAFLLSIGFTLRLPAPQHTRRRPSAARADG